MTMSIMRLLLSFWPCLIVSRVVFGGHLRSISDKIDSSDSTYSYQRSSTKRVLEDGIDPLQEFIGKALLQLPKDVQATQDFGYFGQFEMNISEFRCFDLSFSDIILLSPAWEEEDYVQMEITDFTFKCDFDISWSYGFVNGEGSVYVSTGSNLLTAKRPIRQATMKPATDYYQNVPEETDNCWGTEIEIDELEFNGDMSLRLLNTVRGFIRRNAERELAETFCEILMETLGQGLRLTDQVLREYNTVPLSQEVTNPLYLEAAVAARAEGTGVFMDLQRCQRSKDIECYMIMVALSEVNKMYAAVQYDEDATTIDMKEYGVNSLLRNFVLDDDGAYTWIGSGDESTLSTKTPIVDINTTIHSLKVYGLDSAAVLTPVSIIGHSTISSDLHWDQLALSLNVTIEIAANTSKGTFVGNGDSMEPIKENIIVTAKADNVSATVSMMVPLDEKEVELIPLGYVLGMLPLPDCIPPVLSDIEVSGFNVTAESLQQPTFEGIVSQDIEKLLNSGGGVGKKLYENAILEVLPIIFQTHVRNGLNDNLSEYHCKATGRELKEAIPFSNSPRRSMKEDGPTEEPMLTNESIEEVVESGTFYVNLVAATVCVCVAALAAGLTMGLLSLDPLVLLIKQRAGSSEQDKKDASSLIPIVRQHHLLLVSLLLMNAAANEALPLFLDKLVPGYIAVILSVTLVLFFGEIIPSAVFTGPDQIRIASRLAPVVRFVMLVLSPIAYPIAKVLDVVLHDDESNNLYNRGELSALVRIQYEERMASKHRRKNEMQHALDSENDSIRSRESYSSRRTSGASVRPEISATVRAMKREMSQRNLMARDLHVDEVMMVEGALQMRTTAATEVFTPWSRVFAIPYGMILGEKNIVKIYRSGFSRIPVYETNLDDPDDNTRICGILSSRQLMVVNSHNERPISTLPLARPRCVAPETSLVDLINMFQTGGVEGSHLALVCARPEKGTAALKNGEPLPDGAGLMGIVTLEDVLENLIQEQIYDEYDRQEREQMRLARWGLQRWKMFVKNKKRQRGSSYQSLPGGPKMLDVIEEATATAGREESTPTEKTSLLGKLNIFKS